MLLAESCWEPPTAGLYRCSLVLTSLGFTAQAHNSGWSCRFWATLLLKHMVRGCTRDWLRTILRISTAWSERSISPCRLSCALRLLSASAFTSPAFSFLVRSTARPRLCCRGLCLVELSRECTFACRAYSSFQAVRSFSAW